MRQEDTKVNYHATLACEVDLYGIKRCLGEFKNGKECYKTRKAYGPDAHLPSKDFEPVGWYH